MWSIDVCFLTCRKVVDPRRSSSRDDHQAGQTDTRVLPSPPGGSQSLRKRIFMSSDWNMEKYPVVMWWRQ